MAAPPAPKDMCAESAAVYLNRFREATDYGFTRLEARMFAETGADIGELRRLREAGCPPATAAKILL